MKITDYYCRTCDFSGDAYEARRHSDETGHWTNCPPPKPDCRCPDCSAFRGRVAGKAGSNG